MDKKEITGQEIQEDLVSELYKKLIRSDRGLSIPETKERRPAC